MIVQLLSLKCDFCTASVTDEFTSEEDARRLMAEYGWTQEQVQNGALWDKCPKCSGTSSNHESIGKTNKHNQTVLQPMDNSNKLWLKCEDCGKVYLCTKDEIASRKCPNARKHATDASP